MKAIKQSKFEELPFGIGRVNSGWIAIVVVLLALIGLGIYAYSRQWTEGLVVTGLRDIGPMRGAPWGLYITFDIYFVGVSFAGISIAALIRLLNLTHLRPISRMAELLTITALIIAGLIILPDLGQPVRGLINLFRYARPASPFFGTFTLVISGYLFSSLVYFYLDGRRDAAIMAKVSSKLQWFHRLWAAGYKDTPAERERHKKTTMWLAIAILPLLVTAHSTLGFVFGLQSGRPGWFGALQAPGFTLLAGVSGLGMLILIAAILRKVLKAEEQLNVDIFKWLANFLMLLTIIYLYFTVADLLSSTYSAAQSETRISTALTTGDFSALYWTSIALLVFSAVIGLVQYFTKRFSITSAVLMGLMVNLAAIGKRYLIVVPSQTHGTLLPYGTGSYSPTWVEYGVVLGLFALGTLLYMTFAKVFPIIAMDHQEDESKPIQTVQKKGFSSRAILAWGMVLVGFVIQILSYFFWAAPLGPATSEIYSNPRIPFAPLYFILGVVLVFLAAVVYELLPDKKT